MYIMAHNASSVGQNMAETVAPGASWQIEEVRLHLSGASGATNFTVTMDAGAGAVHDTVLLTVAMNGLTDYVWKPVRPQMMTHASDEIDLAYVNGQQVNWGLTVLWSLI